MGSKGKRDFLHFTLLRSLKSLLQLFSCTSLLPGTSASLPPPHLSFPRTFISTLSFSALHLLDVFLSHFLVFERPTGSPKGPFQKPQLNNNPILKSLPLLSSSSNTSSIDPSVTYLVLSVQDISTGGRQFAETFKRLIFKASFLSYIFTMMPESFDQLNIDFKPTFIIEDGLPSSMKKPRTYLNSSPVPPPAILR